jgi:hypothetical protein
MAYIQKICLPPKHLEAKLKSCITLFQNPFIFNMEIEEDTAFRQMEKTISCIFEQ